MVWWCMVASASPYQMLAPASTVDVDHSVSGASLGYRAATEAPDRGTMAVGAWARYGLADRLEVAGGARVPTSPWTLGLHGGMRYQALGPAGHASGPKASIGAFAGTLLNAVRYPSLVLPLSVGHRSRQVEVYAQPSVTVQSAPGGALTGWTAEAGVAILSAGFPIYITASYGQLGGVDLFGANVGAAYDMAL